MMRKLIHGCFALFAASLLAVGCGSSKKTDTDGGTTNKDKGTITIPDTGGPGIEGGVVPNPDTGVTPTPDQGTTGLSCIEVLQCMNGCGSDQACMTQCISRATPEAQQQIQAIAQCVQTALAGPCATACTDQQSAECNTCLATECEAEEQACTGGGGSGTMSCAQVMQCMMGCGSDQACIVNCVNQGTSEAQQQIQAIAQCVQAASTGACATACTDQASQECNTCLETECQAEMNACLGTTP